MATMPPSPDPAFEVFRQLLAILMKKTKYELMNEMMDARTPAFISDIIRNHPALLGGYNVLDDTNQADDPLVKVTEDIIKAHGFSVTHEWEYDCTTDSRPVCLSIWLGRGKRTKANLRVLDLTEDEATRVQAVLQSKA